MGERALNYTVPVGRQGPTLVVLTPGFDPRISIAVPAGSKLTLWPLTASNIGGIDPWVWPEDQYNQGRANTVCGLAETVNWNELFRGLCRESTMVTFGHSGWRFTSNMTLSCDGIENLPIIERMVISKYSLDSYMYVVTIIYVTVYRRKRRTYTGDNNWKFRYRNIRMLFSTQISPAVTVRNNQAIIIIPKLSKTYHQTRSRRSKNLF